MGLRLYPYDQRTILEFLRAQPQIKIDSSFRFLDGLQVRSQGGKRLCFGRAHSYSEPHLKKLYLQLISRRLFLEDLKIVESMDPYKDTIDDVQQQN